ncbi:MAG: hypothetical protein OHK0038_16340 [Flammeovirgaceae bacterium]
MQNFRQIFLSFFIGLLIGITYKIESKTLIDSRISPKAKLIFADSLFDNGKYTEAFEVYEQLFSEDLRYSPKMLLRMAYIKEGLDDYTKALYYLNLYYLYQADDKVLIKMSELAEKKKLSGYQFTDYEFFMSLYHKYYYHLLIVSFAIMLMVVFLILRAKRKKEPVLSLALLNVFLMGGIFYLFNFVGQNQRGIIDENFTYLMSAPSAGANVLGVLEKGHRLEILGQQDIWFQVRWGEKIAFVRKDNLLIIR